MKILQIAGKNDIRAIYSEAIPDVGQDQALIKISHISLCGSDYKLFNGQYSGPSKYPLVFGHEWSGTVVKINSKKSALKAGSKVTGDCSKWGTDCDFRFYCKIDRNICSRIEKFGITLDGFAREYVSVPVQYLYEAPSEIPMDILALSELFSVALNGIKKSLEAFENQARCLQKPVKECNTLIIGAGSLGIAINILLRYMFKKPDVKIYEISKERVNYISRVFPEFEFVELEFGTDSNRYSDLYSNSSYNIVFEASGYSEAVNTALDEVNAGGTVVLLGMYPEGNIKLNKAVLKNITLKGSIGGTGSFKEIIPFLHSNQDIAAKMITKKTCISELENSNIFERTISEHIKTQVYL